MTTEFKDEVIRLIAAVRRELDLHLQETQRLQDELTHWEKTMQLYEQHEQRRGEGERDSRQNGASIDIGKYEGLSAREIVIKIAQEHDGDILANFVTQVLKQKVKNPNNAGAAAYSIISRLEKQGKVIRIRAGHFRLTNGKQQPLALPTLPPD